MIDSPSNTERLRVADELAGELEALIRHAKEANLDLTTVSLEFSLAMLNRERYRIKTTN